MKTEVHDGLWRIHMALVLSAVICPLGFGFELWRALSGNELSWAYVVEWPILLVVAVHFWRLMVRNARQLSLLAGQAEAAGSATAGDPELLAWERYVARPEGPREEPADSAAAGG